MVVGYHHYEVGCSLLPLAFYSLFIKPQNENETQPHTKLTPQAAAEFQRRRLILESTLYPCWV